MIIVNFGHKLKEKARRLIGAATEHHMPFLLDFEKPIFDQMLVAFDVHVKPLLCDIEKEDDLRIIMPGSSTAAAFFLTAITAYLGYCPKIIILSQVDGEWIPSETADLQKFRADIRAARDNNAIKL